MARIHPPEQGLIAMRIGVEFGSPAEFAASVERALARGGRRGATLVAALDRGDLAVHLPAIDGPAWNVVPLVNLHADRAPGDEAWSTANLVLEKLERYR